jgi:hypothetical protein
VVAGSSSQRRRNDDGDEGAMEWCAHAAQWLGGRWNLVGIYGRMVID